MVGSGRAAVERPEFRWVNTILGNIKTALRGTYHAIRPKYAQRYLSEFEYRFNRRFDLPDIIPRLVYVALRTPPMPERLLELRLACVAIRFDFEFPASNPVCFKPVDLGVPYRSVAELDGCRSLHLAPPTLAVRSVQIGRSRDAFSDGENGTSRVRTVQAQG